MLRSAWILPLILMMSATCAAGQGLPATGRAAPATGSRSPAASVESAGAESSSEKKKAKPKKGGSEKKAEPKKAEPKKESKPAGEKKGADASAAAHEESPDSPSEQALAQLKAGNQRFRGGTPTHPRQDAVRLAEMNEKGQNPFVTILCCSDSRVPPELVFDQGLGDLFIVRVAGNVADTDEIGTMEYGVGHLHTPLLVVLGHEKCGAVTAVATSAELEGSIPELVDNIEPAVAEAQRLPPGLTGEALVPFAVRANVMQAIKDLLTRSPLARELVAERDLMIVGAIYDLGSGKVNWLGSHPEEATLVRSARGSTNPTPGRVAQH